MAVAKSPPPLHYFCLEEGRFCWHDAGPHPVSIKRKMETVDCLLKGGCSTGQEGEEIQADGGNVATQIHQ